MAYTYYIDPSVNCVFVRHFDNFELDDALNQYREMVKHPKHHKNLNVLRDVLSTSLPDEFGFKFFSEKTPTRYKDLEAFIGASKVAWVLGSGADYAIMHQFTLTTRLKPLGLITRKPFRSIEKAKAWLDVPPGYEINHDSE